MIDKQGALTHHGALIWARGCQANAGDTAKTGDTR